MKQQEEERMSKWMETIDAILSDWVFPIGAVLIVIWFIRFICGQ